MVYAIVFALVARTWGLGPAVLAGAVLALVYKSRQQVPRVAPTI